MTQPKKALVVEDDETMAGLICDLLEDLGFHVTTEENGHSAFRLATTAVFDLITLDINLPGWRGTEMLNSLDLVQEQTPIIVITGTDIPAIETEVTNPSVRGILPKPFEISEFRELVKNLTV